MANQQLKAKLVSCNVPTKNIAASRKFYSALFGGDDFARSLNDKVESYFRPIDQSGLTLTVATRWDAREPLTCYFAVDNLDQTVRDLEAAGGKIVVNSTPMPISAPAAAKQVLAQTAKGLGEQAPDSAGQFVTMLDPDGNYIGLMQLEGAVQTYFNAEPAKRQLTQEQVTLQDNWKQHGEPLMTK